VVAIGQSERDRNEYLGIAAMVALRAETDMDDHDEGPPPKDYKQLASYTMPKVHEACGLGGSRRAIYPFRRQPGTLWVCMSTMRSVPALLTFALPFRDQR
jgi:hypothetical protein